MSVQSRPSGLVCATSDTTRFLYAAGKGGGDRIGAIRYLKGGIYPSRHVRKKPLTLIGSIGRYWWPNYVVPTMDTKNLAAGLEYDGEGKRKKTKWFQEKKKMEGNKSKDRRRLIFYSSNSRWTIKSNTFICIGSIIECNYLFACYRLWRSGQTVMNISFYSFVLNHLGTNIF